MVNEKKYETFYILDPASKEDDVNAINNKIDNVISAYEGKLSKRDDWGIVELAYPLKKKKNGRIFVIQYTGKSGVVEEIERHFKISNFVMRYISVAVGPDYNYEKIKKQIKKMEDDLDSRSYEQKMDKKLENVEKAKS